MKDSTSAKDNALMNCVLVTTDTLTPSDDLAHCVASNETQSGRRDHSTFDRSQSHLPPIPRPIARRRSPRFSRETHVPPTVTNDNDVIVINPVTRDEYFEVPVTTVKTVEHPIEVPVIREKPVTQEITVQEDRFTYRVNTQPKIVEREVPRVMEEVKWQEQVEYVPETRYIKIIEEKLVPEYYPVTTTSHRVRYVPRTIRKETVYENEVFEEEVIKEKIRSKRIVKKPKKKIIEKIVKKKVYDYEDQIEEIEIPNIITKEVPVYIDLEPEVIEEYTDEERVVYIDEIQYVDNIKLDVREKIVDEPDIIEVKKTVTTYVDVPENTDQEIVPLSPERFVEHPASGIRYPIEDFMRLFPDLEICYDEIVQDDRDD